DRNVTGVQTCALPICARIRRRRDGVQAPRDERHAQGDGSSRRHSREVAADGQPDMAAIDPDALAQELMTAYTSGRGVSTPPSARSEERRVGKECSAWW